MTSARAHPDHDLERAAAALAHDLQEPLRAISSWCGLLRERLGGELDEVGAGWLAQAQAAAERGRALVRDVLELSRAGAERGPLEPVCLADALAEALANLGAALDESGARLDVGPLPAVRARHVDVVRVLQNVLANALLYRRGHGPRVAVSARSRDGVVELRVDDDGVGIHPADVERAFEPFTRLRPGQGAGTGLGLALCRRLVRAHGGEVVLAPRVGGGTRCSVRWMADDAAPERATLAGEADTPADDVARAGEADTPADDDPRA